MAKDKTMKALLASIEAKEAEIARLTAQVEALRDVYEAEAGIVPQKKTRAPRSDVKNSVFKYLKQVGETGLNAQVVCEMAKREGKELNPKSVSSLLSRLAKDGVIHYDQIKYRLPEFAPHKQETRGLMPQGSIHPIRASGQSRDGF